MSSLDITEKFPHLTNAPIVEAALDIRVVPSNEWNEKTLLEQFKKTLTDYPQTEAIRESNFKVEMAPEKNEMSYKDGGCVGVKLTSKDNLYISQFKKIGFVLSRLKPYEDWEHFIEEALRLWAIYYDLLKPIEVKRIGLRFVNRISIPGKTSIEVADYYKNPPSPLREVDWPLAGFFHHDVLQISSTSYAANVIKTIQNTSNDIGLILDIDVYIQKQFEYDKKILCRYLEEMRWIKNKVFFNNLTDQIIEGMK